MSRLLGHPVLRRVIGVIFALSIVAPTSSAGNIVGASSSPPVALPGHVLRSLSKLTRVAALPSDQPLSLTIALRPSSPDALDQAIAAAQLQFDQVQLSPDSFGQTYGQPQVQIDAITTYFRSAGFAVQPPAADHLTLKISGTAAQVEKTLGVNLDTYADHAGHQFFATSRDPSLPADLVDSVQAIYGLDNYPALHPFYLVTQGSAGAYVPKDIQTAYNITPLYTDNFTGAGQTIAIVGCDSFQLSDIQTFQQDFQLPVTGSIPVTNVGNGPNPPSTSAIEGTLDLEWAGAIATGAALRYYGFDCTFGGFLDTMTKVVNDNAASVVSISLGACETIYSGSNYLQPIENELAAAVAKNQSILVASGDQGAYCFVGPGQPTPFGVSYPASSAYVTAVGGTTLATTTSSTYLSETAWGSQTGCNGSPCGSGGGTSGSIGEPTWQSGAGIPSTGGMRGVPDVALNADPNSGQVIYFTMNGSIGCQGLCGGIGGTSIAAPQWAGLAAIANQAAGKRLGQLAPLLYSNTVTSRQSLSCAAYHDVTSGNNLFYSAMAGWDFTTGWGSTNAYNLLRALVPSIPPVTSAVAVTPAARLGGLAATTSSLKARAFIPLLYQTWVAC